MVKTYVYITYTSCDDIVYQREREKEGHRNACVVDLGSVETPSGYLDTTAALLKPFRHGGQQTQHPSPSLSRPSHSHTLQSMRARVIGQQQPGEGRAGRQAAASSLACYLYTTGDTVALLPSTVFRAINAAVQPARNGLP